MKKRDLRDCIGCQHKREFHSKGCHVYTDRRNVMLNESGGCYSKVTDPKEKERIEEACRVYAAKYGANYYG